MFARRFRLDSEGNLHADGLFCRPIYCEPTMTTEAHAWAQRRLPEARKAKSVAILAFEAAWSAGQRDEAHVLARSVHVHMLAQRLRKPSAKSRLSR